MICNTGCIKGSRARGSDTNANTNTNMNTRELEYGDAYAANTYRIQGAGYGGWDAARDGAAGSLLIAKFEGFAVIVIRNTKQGRV